MVCLVHLIDLLCLLLWVYGLGPVCLLLVWLDVTRWVGCLGWMCCLLVFVYALVAAFVLCDLGF